MNPMNFNASFRLSEKFQKNIAQSAEVVEYTDCFSAEG